MNLLDGTVTTQVTDIVDLFDTLNGEKQLEFLGILLEKMENGEIEIMGKPIYPEAIGVDDAYTCYSTILDIVTRY
jgi:hypothetical protein